MRFHYFFISSKNALIALHDRYIRMMSHGSKIGYFYELTKRILKIYKYS